LNRAQRNARRVDELDYASARSGCKRNFNDYGQIRALPDDQRVSFDGCFERDGTSDLQRSYNGGLRPCFG
jgi:hypothetical protein